MTKRKFYRTKVTVTVLSEEPLSSDISLEGIEYGGREGGWSVETSVGLSHSVSGPQMAKLLESQGTSPDLFQLDENGVDLDE